MASGQIASRSLECMVSPTPLFPCTQRDRHVPTTACRAAGNNDNDNNEKKKKQKKKKKKKTDYRKESTNSRFALHRSCRCCLLVGLFYNKFTAYKNFSVAESG